MKTISEHNNETTKKRERGTEIGVVCDVCKQPLRIKPPQFRSTEDVLRGLGTGGPVPPLHSTIPVVCHTLNCPKREIEQRVELPLPAYKQADQSPVRSVSISCSRRDPPGDDSEFVVVVDLPITFTPGRDPRGVLTGPGWPTILANGVPLGTVDTDYHTAREYVNALANVVNAGVRSIRMADLFVIEDAVRESLRLPTRFEADYDAGNKGWD